MFSAQLIVSVAYVCNDAAVELHATLLYFVVVRIVVATIYDRCTGHDLDTATKGFLHVTHGN